jgi:hypothetical protein
MKKIIFAVLFLTTFSAGVQASQIVCDGKSTKEQPFKLVIDQSLYLVVINPVTGLPVDQGTRFAKWNSQTIGSVIAGYRVTNVLFRQFQYIKADIRNGHDQSTLVLGADTLSHGIKWTEPINMTCRMKGNL